MSEREMMWRGGREDAERLERLAREPDRMERLGWEPGTTARLRERIEETVRLAEKRSDAAAVAYLAGFREGGRGE